MSNIRNNNPFPVAIKKEEGVVDEDDDDTINNDNSNKRQRRDGGGNNLTRGAGSVQVKREEEDNNNNNDTGGSITTTTNPNPTISTTSSSGNNNNSNNNNNNNMMMTDEDKDNITNNNVVTTSTTTSITRTDIDTDTDNNDNNNEAAEQPPPPPSPPLASHITVKEWINVTDLLFSTSSKNYDVNMNVLDDYENTFINNICISLENKFLCPMTNELKIIICNHVKGLIANKNNNNDNSSSTSNNKRCRDDHHDDDDDGPPTKKAGGTSTATTTTTTTTTDDDDSPSLPSPEVAQEPAIAPSIKIKRSSSRHRQTTDRLVDHGGTTTCYSNDYYCNNYNYNNGGKTKPSSSNNDNDAAAAAAATPTSNDDFFKMTVKELQSESRKRAIPYSGLRKFALVESLQSRMNSTAIGADPVSSPSVVVVAVAAGTIIADAATDADGVGRSINNKKLPPLSSSSSSSNNLRNARQGEDKSSNNNNNNSRKKKKTKRSEAEQDDCSVLSTPYELSKLLCEIVNIKTTTSGGDDNGDDERHYHSREDSLRTLKKLYRWSYNEGNGKFLKYFHRYAGMYKLLDFMSIVLNDNNHNIVADDDNNNNNFNIDNYIGNVDMDNKILIDNMNCIKYVSGIIGCICCKGDWEDNRDIAIKLASTLLHDYNCDDDDNEDDDPNNNNDSGDGLEILLRLNQQFNPTLFNSYGNDNGDGDIAIEIDKNNNNNISSLELKSIQEIWNALRNMTSFDDTILLSEKQAVMVLDSGIQMIEKLTNITTTSCSTTSTAAHIADSSNNNNSSSNISIMISGILYQIFGAFKNIILDDLITKKDFRRLNVVSKCLQIFQQHRTATTMEKKKKKKKGSSSNKGVVDDAISWNMCSGDEALTEVALDFLDGCRFRKLLSSSSSKSSSNDDYETILPVCVISLDEFGSTNYIIRNAVIELLEAAISSKVPTRKIELAGVKEFNKGIIQVLSHIRTSADIDVDEKGRLRKLIFKIMGE